MNKDIYAVVIIKELKYTQIFSLPALTSADWPVKVPSSNGSRLAHGLIQFYGTR